MTYKLYFHDIVQNGNTMQVCVSAESSLYNFYVATAGGGAQYYAIQLEVTYLNLLGPRGVQITKMFGSVKQISICIQSRNSYFPFNAQQNHGVQISQITETEVQINDFLLYTAIQSK